MNKLNDTKISSQVNCVIHLLMICLGIVGGIGGIISSLYFPNVSYFGMGLLILLGFVFYYLYLHKKTIWQFVIVLEIVVFAFLFILNSADFMVLIDKLINVIKHDYFLSFDSIILGVKSPVLISNVLILFIGIPLTALLTSLVVKGKRFFIKMFFVLLLMIFPVLIKHQLGIYSSYCLVIFLLYEYVFGYALRFQKKNLSVKLTILSSLTVLLLFSSFFLEANPIFSQKTSDVLTNISQWIDNTRFDDMTSSQKITGVSANVDGSLPTGSVQSHNGIAMKVTSPVKMSTYLRGYSMAYYDNNEWQPVLKQYDQINSLTLFSNHLLDTSLRGYTAKVKVEPTKKTSYQFLPYFSLLEAKNYDDSYYKRSDLEIPVIYNKDNKFESLITNAKKGVYSNYLTYVHDQYMNIPEELSAKITDLFESKYKEEMFKISSFNATYSEKIAFVKKVLDNETSYDLNAGDLPKDKDFVDYFLFENKKGSCTHYATTATLMLRSLGVPTRYTSGFIMKESDFNGEVATIRNNRAHAWIEVYYDGLGWLPYEVTPVANAGEGTEIDSMAQMLDENSQNQQNQEQQNNNQQNQNTQSPTTNNSNNNVNQSHWYDIIVENAQYFIAGAIIVIILLCYRFYTYQIFFIKLKKKSVNEKVVLYYQRMKKMSSFGKEIDDSIKSIVLKAQFSQYNLIEEINVIEAYYQRFNLEIYQDLSWYKKFIYKFVFGYK